MTHNINVLLNIDMSCEVNYKLLHIAMLPWDVLFNVGSTYGGLYKSIYCSFTVSKYPLLSY